MNNWIKWRSPKSIRRLYRRQDEDTSGISVCIWKEIFTNKEIYFRYSARKIIVLKVDWQFKRLIKLVSNLVILKESRVIQFNLLK